MRTRTLMMLAMIAVAYLFARGESIARADCTLDHYFLGQDEGKLIVDQRRIYRHGDPDAGYYPLAWSMIYGCWSAGEPGFSDTTDPAYGMPEEMLLDGVRNVDYQVWCEIIDITPDFKVRMDDGAWLTQVGDRYNLSSIAEHHAHMKYRAYVPSSPTPEEPMWVTFRLVDDYGVYAASAPFSCVFNAPTPTVMSTLPLYQSALASRTEAEMVFTFHRPITVEEGFPVAITDEATGTQDFSGFFDYEVSPDGLSLILTQVGSTLPEDTDLAVSLTTNVRDAVETTRSAVPFTLLVNTQAGDLNCDGSVDGLDIAAMMTAMTDWATYRDAYPGCRRDRADCNADGVIDLADVEALISILLDG